MRTAVFAIFFGAGLASAGGLYTVSTMLSNDDGAKMAAADVEQQSILRSLVERPFARWRNSQDEGLGIDESQSSGELAQTASLSLDEELKRLSENVPDLTEPDQPASGMVELDIVRVEPSGETVLAGRAAPNSRIVVMSDGVVVAQGEVNSFGEFAIVLAEPLAPGVHDIRIENQPSSDNGDGVTRDPVFLSVAIPEGDEREVLVLLDRPGQLSRIIQKPDSLAPSALRSSETEEPDVAALDGWSLPEPASDRPRARVETVPTMAIEAVETEGDSFYVAGTARPGAHLRIYLDDAFIGTATAQPSGHWILETKSRIEQGEHRIRADRVAGPGGEVLARAEVPLMRRLEGTVLANAGTQIPAAAGDLVSKRVIIRQGDNLWTISRRMYGSGFRYTTIFQANADQIVNPDLIYPGQVFQLPLRDRQWDNDRSAANVTE